MKKLSKILFGISWLVVLLIFPDEDADAITIAEQTQAYDSTLSVWEAIQELGNNLSGTVTNFTFRVSTSTSNQNQFDYTAANTRIYDKENNTYIVGCVPANSNPNDGTRGLVFKTSDVPAGYEDVTIDFSCRNYNFIQSHRYLILISNANMPQWGGKRIKFAATISEQFTGGGLRFAYDNGYCNAASYIWNSQTANSGCNIFSNSKADLYFVLNNNAPPPRLPVIFIPGIGGSEMKATQDIIWSAGDGHGGTYSHAYSGNEKIWVNQNEAANLGNDDYFDVLRLKTDGVTPEADLSLTGNLTSFGYPDIDSFFTGMGYVKGTNFFVFPYDWRKDIRTTKDNLDALIESAKTASGQSKVNLVVHSMGGLVAHYFISDATKAAKVNKLIELGIPHLGASTALKTLMYGSALEKNVFGFIPLGIPASEVRDLSQNTPSIFQLLPASKYFDFYNNLDKTIPFPYRDDRDIDNNKITGALNFDQIKTLLTNLNYNMTVFTFGELFHSNLDPILNQTNGVKIYEIAGTAQPTLGQIHETWWITWPVNLIPKTDEIFINGDGTVPLYSASLKNDNTDISGATKIYYVEQEHGKLTDSNGSAMQTVKNILNDDNSLPVEVKEQKFNLEGQQISWDDGELDLYDDQNRHCGQNDNGDFEENIPDVTCTSSGKTKHAFVRKKASKVKVRTTRKNPSVNSRSTNLKIRTYQQDQISKTTIYQDIALPQEGKIEFNIDPATDTSPSLTFYPDSTKEENVSINPTSEITGSAATDQTSPTTTVQTSGTNPVTVTLTGTDSESGILKIEYSLDNGQTVQTYTNPFVISNSGDTTIQVTSTDNTGNEEIPQSTTITIAPTPTPTPTPSPSPSPNPSASANTTASSSNSDSDSNSSSSTTAISVNSSDNSKTEDSSLFSPPDVLGVTFANPRHISDEINLSGLLDQQEKLKIEKKVLNPFIENLGGLLMVSGGFVAFASLGLLVTLFKPPPKYMYHPKPKNNINKIN